MQPTTMNNLSTSVYTYLGDMIILEDGQDWWILYVLHVDDQDQNSDIALKHVNVRYVLAPLELGTRVGEMSRANCVSLVQLAELGAPRFCGNLTWKNPADCSWSDAQGNKTTNSTATSYISCGLCVVRCVVASHPDMCCDSSELHRLSLGSDLVGRMTLQTCRLGDNQMTANRRSFPRAATLVCSSISSTCMSCTSEFHSPIQHVHPMSHFLLPASFDLTREGQPASDPTPIHLGADTATPNPVTPPVEANRL